MRILLVLAAACLASTKLSAQENTGFYGKKVFVEFNTSGQLAFLNAVFNSESSYKSNGKKLLPGNDLFNGSLHFVVGAAVSKKIALSLETSMFFASFSTPSYLSKPYTDEYGYYSSEEIYFRHELIDFRTLTIMPKLEISGEGGNSPSGLSHQVGIGYTTSKVVDKAYLYKVDNAYNVTDSSSLDLSTSLLDRSQTYKGVSVMYAINMRTPLSRRLFINYGIRYTINVRSHDYPAVKTAQYWLSPQEAAFELGRVRALSLISLQLGISLAL